MVGTPSGAHSRDPLALPTLRFVRYARLLRNLPEGLADRKDGMPDQPGILHRRLPMLYCFPINRVADHLREGGDIRIFGEEAMMPAFLLRPDQHQFELALPNDAAAEPFEHRTAFPAIGRIGFRAG